MKNDLHSSLGNALREFAKLLQLPSIMASCSSPSARLDGGHAIAFTNQVAIGTSVEDRRDHTSLLARCRNSGIC